MFQELSYIPLLIGNTQEGSSQDRLGSLDQGRSRLTGSRSGIAGLDKKGFASSLILGIEGPDPLPIDLFLAKIRDLHLLSGKEGNGVGVHIDNFARDLAQFQEGSAQRELKLLGVLHGDTGKKAIFGRGGAEEREAREGSKIGLADRIQGTNASGCSKASVKDQLECDPLRGNPFFLGQAEFFQQRVDL